MDILALILAFGLGYGIVFVIFSYVLDKSNDIGNNVGSADRYTIGIAYDVSRDKLSDDEIDSFGNGYIRNEDRIRNNEPDVEQLVEQTLSKPDNLGWNSKLFHLFFFFLLEMFPNDFGFCRTYYLAQFVEGGLFQAGHGLPAGG